MAQALTLGCSQDQPYLMPIIEQIKVEQKEKEDLDSLTIVKNH